MTRMVQVLLAADLAEAETVQALLDDAGIASSLETAVEHHPSGTEDAPQRVLVAEDQLEAAETAIETLTDSEQILGDDAEQIPDD